MSLNRFFQVDLPRIKEELKHHSTLESRQPLSFDLHYFDLSELLTHCICERLFYFCSKDQNFSFLGLGLAKEFNQLNLHHFFSQYPEDFVSTQLNFEFLSENDENSHFVLHEWSFIQKENSLRLILFKNNDSKYYTSPSQLIDEFIPDDEDDFIPPWSHYEEVPEHDEWPLMIEKANAYFDSKKLDKIVLSRKKIFEFNESIDPLSFFKILVKKNKLAPSYKIFQRSTFNEAFLSLTPEMLFILNGQSFESISLAGSTPRGATENEDRLLEEQLITDEKLIREHSLVTDEITQRLRPISYAVNVMDLETMKLPYIQHRRCDIKASLKEGVKVLDLLRLLHPTPAVGGLPREMAGQALLEIEGQKRGPYAAPIGIISRDRSELAVGIRSALLSPHKITLFGGAGIVKGSLAEEEWNETGTKMNPFLKVIQNE